MKDWEVFDDVYVAAFSFARYQMWQDLRRNMDVFSKNELISSLLNNRCEIKDVKDVEFKEDECPPTQTLMPLPADSSQWEAVALSQTGKTFVLHGPSGNGQEPNHHQYHRQCSERRQARPVRRGKAGGPFGRQKASGRAGTGRILPRTPFE